MIFPTLTWCLLTKRCHQSCRLIGNGLVRSSFLLYPSLTTWGDSAIGYAIGNATLIRALRQIKAVIDFNQYQGILNGAITALTDGQAQIYSSG